MCMPMHQVLSPSSTSGASTGCLYIGSLSAVNDKDLLRDHRISHLVQVLDAAWLPISEKDGFDCYRISILDHSTVDLRPHLEGACNYIDRALRSGRNVLVHCQQVSIPSLSESSHLIFTRVIFKGVSRSAAIVIAYLIRNHGMSFDNAHALVKRKRACIKPNPGFVQALQEWESMWRHPGMSRRFTS